MHDTDDIARKVDECRAWRDVDADALTLLLRTHREVCLRDDPAQWSVSDVEAVMEALTERELSPGLAEALSAAWLTWFDFLVETCGLTPPSSAPRELRSLVEGAGEALRGIGAAPGDYGRARKLVAAMMAEGVDPDDEDAVKVWMDRLLRDPARVAEVMRGPASPRRTVVDRARQTVEALPPVRLAPTAELAAAARACEPLRAALDLARWVGQGRPLAEGADGLSAADAEAAGVADRPWVFGTAVDAGLLRLSYTEVLPGPRLGDWPDGDDDAVLDVWVGGFDAAASGPASPMLGSMLLTNLFLSGVPELPLKEVTEQLRSMAPEIDELAVPALERLAAYGAVRPLDGERLAITPLGVYAVVERLRRNGQHVRVLPDPASLSAGELVSVLGTARAADVEELAAGWFAARDPLDGARALLAEVEAPEAYVARSMVVHLVGGLGRAAAPLWRELTGHLTLGGWARRGLRDLGETSEEDRTGDLWMLLDAWGTSVEQGYPEEVAENAGRLGEEAGSLLEVIWRLGHPAAEPVLNAISMNSRDKKLAKVARRAVFKLGSSR
ncbi:hypothetical protein [Planobispora rosea]|nr:hypothetical protein [Planobispora rosea]